MLMAINKTSQRTLSESVNDKIYQSARVRSSRGTDGVRTFIDEEWRSWCFGGHHLCVNMLMFPWLIRPK